MESTARSTSRPRPIVLKVIAAFSLGLAGQMMIGDTRPTPAQHIKFWTILASAVPVVVRVVLGLVLLSACWPTWRGRRTGSVLHRVWASATLLNDALELALLLGGWTDFDPALVVEGGYACALLIVLARPRVKSSFEHSKAAPAGADDPPLEA